MAAKALLLRQRPRGPKSAVPACKRPFSAGRRVGQGQEELATMVSRPAVLVQVLCRSGRLLDVAMLRPRLVGSITIEAML